MLLENFYQSFLSWFEQKLSSEQWLWKVTIFSVALALFLAFPPYNLLLDHLTGNGMSLDAWVFIRNQAEDLFHPADMDYDVRRENMIFRWTLPLLSLLTGHSVVLILIIQGILGVFFVKKIGDLVYRLSNDKVLTGLILIAISNIFVVVWAFADVHGYGDGFAYFFLLAALLSRHYLIIFLSLQFAFFTDERAVVAAGYVLLWWMVVTAYRDNDFTFAGLFRRLFTHESLVVWIAWVAYFGVRFYVQAKYFSNHSYSTIGTPVLFANAHRNGLGSSIWGAFEGTWLIMLAAVLVLVLTRRFWLLTALFVGFIVLLATGIYVHDIDRALSYGFPFILLSVFILLKNASNHSLRLIAVFAAVICVSHPQVFYMGYNKILWLEPFPMKIVMYFDRMLGWDFFF